MIPRSFKLVGYFDSLAISWNTVMSFSNLLNCCELIVKKCTHCGQPYIVGEGELIDHMHMTSQKGAHLRWGSNRGTATCVIAKHAARGATPACHTAGLARLGPRTERLSANAHCQHNTCPLRDTSLALLLWRCDPLWRQCIRSIRGHWYV